MLGLDICFWPDMNLDTLPGSPPPWPVPTYVPCVLQIALPASLQS